MRFFSGGKGFVRFRIREDGNIVVLVPVSASIPRVPYPLHSRDSLSQTNHKFHHIRLTHEEKQRIQEHETASIRNGAGSCISGHSAAYLH